MKTRISLALLAISVLFRLTSCGQTSITIPENFVKTVPPNTGSPEWLSLNNTANDFSVKKVNEKLEIKKICTKNKCELKLSNGTLIGINRGEWGGSLLFKPADTTKNTIKIKDGNIEFIFKFKNKIYFIEGLAHLSISTGSLFELNNVDGNYIFKKKIDFEDAPEAFTIFQDKLLVVTHKNFYTVKDFKKELVFKDTFWESLYPNSIVVFDESNVFIGIRGGIVKLDLKTKNISFYKAKL